MVGDYKKRWKKWWTDTENLLAVILIVVGVCAMAWIAIKWNQERKISADYIKTEGIIVDYTITGSKEDRMFWPIVEYKVEGNTYQIDAEYGSGRKRKNNQIFVKFNPDYPEEAIVVEKEGPGVFFVVGFIFTAIGIAMLLGKARSGRVQLSGMLLGSSSFFVALCAGLYSVKGTESSWNPISIIAYNPVAILIYLLLIVSGYLVLSSLWAIFTCNTSHE